MGNLWKQNWKIAAGKSPTVADEPGEVLTYGQGVDAVPSGDFVAGPGMSIDASGTPGNDVLVFTNTGGGTGASGIAGPGSSTDRALATWDGTGGDTLRDTSVTLSATNLLTIPALGGISNAGVVINNVTTFGSSPATAAATDFFCILGAAGAFTFTLPAGPVAGQTVIVKDGAFDAGTATKTIVPTAGTIDGLASVTLSANGASINFIYDGSEWKAF